MKSEGIWRKKDLCGSPGKEYLPFKVLFCITQAMKRKGTQFGQPGHTTVWTYQVAVEAAAKWRAQEYRLQVATASQGKKRQGILPSPTNL